MYSRLGGLGFTICHVCLQSSSSEEKFVDVDAVLSEAMGLANEDFVFESEGTMV